VEVLVAHNNAEVVVGFLWCKKKKKFVVEKEERLAVMVTVVGEEMG
jgi:hypothetical protein